MIRITELKLPVTHDPGALKKKAASILRIGESAVRTIDIVSRSIDARQKPDLFYVYTLDVDIRGEEQVLRKQRRHKNIMSISPQVYSFPEHGNELPAHRPVIVGSGPCGLFAAYHLALAGMRPVILERGEDALTRSAKVSNFFAGGPLDPECNVQFGEGGAGTFSDGKLNTSVKDPGLRGAFVKQAFVEFGAPENILYDRRPHVGTDELIPILIRMRKRIEELGGEYHFSSKMTGFTVSASGHISSVLVNDSVEIPADICILAPGHSARDTFRMLQSCGVLLESKSFAAGVRIEHPQEMIDLAQYGQTAPAETGPAPYKLTHRTENGRGVYSFCMCPGGYVVDSSSEKGYLAVNGMSYSGRDSKNANSALIITVSPSDFDPYADAQYNGALSGIAFQRRLEELAYRTLAGKIPQQLYGDFLKRTVSSGYGNFGSCVRGTAGFADLREILPEFMSDSLISGISAFGRKIDGFDRPDAILSGVESRSSSPVRIVRDDRYVSSVEGLYPAGEGAGYAGGIMSAAMDGVRVSEAIVRRYKAINPGSV
ncbi:MAG: FAD-dependent oxidoreductase [Lachnospiraceae bacterium]|nr:FAD-dependent oxidoreductase [Lachnospiraceae bacterium]